MQFENIILDKDMKRFKEYIDNDKNMAFYCENKSHDNEIAYLYQTGIPVSEIQDNMSQTYGSTISIGEIYRSLSRIGVNPSRRQRPYRDDIFHLNTNGFGLEEISQITGYSTRHIRNLLQQQQSEISDDSIRE